MTEKLQPLSTQIAIPSQILSATPVPATTFDVPHKVEVVEEEPYTIRCICNFSDDDGSTIYCETCDTWQHIDCYYPDNREEVSREDFAHSCVHCKPRPLDKQRAIERTRQLRSVILPEAIDRKHAKRPPSKSHKKKPKPTDLLLNGNNPAHEPPKHPSPNEPSHAPKKSKHSHKPSQSTSQGAKRSPSYGNSRTQPNGHPPSPANTPPDLPLDFQIHDYSTTFLSLYNSSDIKIVESNSYAKINVLNSMAKWLREPEALRADTGHTYTEVFRSLLPDFDSKRPQIRVDDKRAPAPSTSDTLLHWKSLTTPTPVDKNIPLIELNGQIGIQKDYCDDPNNMWGDLSSPLPFVFFHPDIPLYIDTRREGSQARYVRRSCKPNATLETYISGAEYHFWLVSDQYIGAGDQITLPWDFRLPRKEKVRYLQLIDLGDEETKGGDEPEMDETEYLNISNWLHRILSEYGGCACDRGNNCAFARFHRRNQARLIARTTQAKKRSRKAKPSNTISPTSTGQATNSRAPSEGHMDETADDARSTSGDSHSKAPSRDLTPAPRQGSFDTFTGILTEPTGRDKRKVAMLEDQFRALEQPRPKKKRVSDGSTSTSSKTKSRNPTNGRTPLTNGTGHYVDAATSRSKSGSPVSAISPIGAQSFKPPIYREGSGSGQSRHASVGPNPAYVDAAVQTDPTEGDWYSPCKPVLTRPRRIVSLSKRLLESRHKVRTEEQGRRTSQSSLAESMTAMDIDTAPTDIAVGLSSPHDSEKQLPLVSPGCSVTGDVVMADVLVPSPLGSKPPFVMLAPPTPMATSPIKKSPDLRVQMPPVPVFNGPSMVTTPMSASGSIVQSPFSATNLTSPFTPTAPNGTAPHQSPVRKKLSLSDYKKSKLDKSAAGRTLKTSTSNLEENKPLLDSIADSPTAEKAAESAFSMAAAN